MFSLLCRVIIVSSFHWIYFKSFVWFLAAQAAIYCWYQLTTSALIISDLWITSTFEHPMVCDTKSDHQMGVSDPAILIIKTPDEGQYLKFHHSLDTCDGIMPWKWFLHCWPFVCEENHPVTGGFPSQRASNAGLWCFFCASLNKLLNKQSSYWWFEMMLTWNGVGVWLTPILSGRFSCSLKLDNTFKG